MNNIYPYAGFWKRALAFVIDSFVLSIPVGLVLLALWVPQIMSIMKMAASGAEPSPEVMMGIMTRYFASMALTWLIAIVGGWLYYALLESGKHQATLGKRALRIKVTGSHGQRITFARATGRFFAKMISGMTLYFGFYMAGFTQKRQALHDIVADTFVVDKQAQEGPELPALPFSKGFCATGIIVAVAPIVMYIGMIILMIAAGVAAGMNEAEHPRPAAITQQVQP